MYILCRNREDCATASERKCAAASEYIFFMLKIVSLLLEAFQYFFKESAAASEKILNDCF